MLQLQVFGMYFTILPLYEIQSFVTRARYISGRVTQDLNWYIFLQARV